MLSHFSRLNEDITRMKTRASATDFFLPRVCGQGTTTLFFSAIKEWNDLPTIVKNATCETTFKIKLKENLIKEAKKVEISVFTK